MSDVLPGARAALGALTILVILALTVYDALVQGSAVTNGRLMLLLGIAASLLGVDMVLDRLPLNVRISEEDTGNDDTGP